MKTTPARSMAMGILLFTGFAAVDPYPPAARDYQPYKSKQPVQTEKREAKPGALLAQIDEQVQDTNAGLTQIDEQVQDIDAMLAQIDEQETIVEDLPAPIYEQYTDVEDLLAELDEQQHPAAGITEWTGTDEEEFWQQLRNDFRQSQIRHKKISKQVARYAKNPYPIKTTLKRGEPYLAYIRHEVEKRGFPAEVVLLPFVESGYDPFAYSHGRAAGLWQFIPSTARYFGLKQDWWYDERRDIVASTNAALDYLDKLQKQFDGDWLLTLAAYNAGGWKVRKAIQRNRKAGKPIDFWHLKLPDETAAYVPKLLAICRIIDNPEKYGVELPDIDNTPGFAIIETGDQLDIAIAAELAEMKSADLQLINPGFNRWATHPDGPHRLAIPIDKADTFTRNLAKLQASDRIKWLRHKTEAGETLSHLALRYRTTVKVLQQSNHMDSTRIRTGSFLLVPVAARNASAYATPGKDQQHSATNGHKITHEVKAGDNLSEIAQRYQSRVALLKKWNQLGSSSLIKPGQQLVIWKNSNVAAPGKHIRTVYYTVRSGDTLSGISRKYNVSIKDLQDWNSLHGDRYLQPGQNLTVHVDVTRLSIN
ncbi:MAG: LysM peptidoglycan-binding domain-containing protein [Gammaproteobacteria bacterium]